MNKKEYIKLNQIQSDHYHAIVDKLYGNIDYLNRMRISDSRDVQKELSRIYHVGLDIRVEPKGLLIKKDVVTISAKGESIFIIEVRRVNSFTEYAVCYSKTEDLSIVDGYITLLNEVCNNINNITKRQ
jgi:hypothetical protein